MNLLVTHGDTPETARWTGLWNEHPFGLVGYSDHRTRYCCTEGHVVAVDALRHAASLEIDRLTAILPANCPPGSIGAIALSTAA